MNCEKKKANGDSDSLELKASIRPFDKSPTAWLLGQAVRYLNTAGKKGEFEYTRVVEILSNCNDALLENVKSIFASVKGGDTTLRWNLLYIIGDASDYSSADFLVDVVLNPLPENDGDCCESNRDMEMLVSTGAVNALYRVAKRHPEVMEYILKVISERPDRPILIEAVKVAVELGLEEQVQKLLSKEDLWILGIRRVRPQELFTEPEREDGKERGFTPPKSGAFYTAPSILNCTTKEN